jgi:hypothetical protein
MWFTSCDHACLPPPLCFLYPFSPLISTLEDSRNPCHDHSSKPHLLLLTQGQRLLQYLATNFLNETYSRWLLHFQDIPAPLWLASAIALFFLHCIMMSGLHYQQTEIQQCHSDSFHEITGPSWWNSATAVTLMKLHWSFPWGAQSKAVALVEYAQAFRPKFAESSSASLSLSLIIKFWLIWQSN